MNAPTPGLRWERDSAGDSLWLGEEFLGCIYNRDGIASRANEHGWRALAGEEMIPIEDTLVTREQPDARLGARALLEAHCGFTSALPSAAELMSATS
ncbi:hypothetical protein [Streptomyces sp. NPDC059761]|uniref:hypothetical protein n=1 Tax=Streptomyces sp. NPDC059761 TaxID=3346937 RepID=UPI00364ED022